MLKNSLVLRNTLESVANNFFHVDHKGCRNRPDAAIIPSHLIIRQQDREIEFVLFGERPDEDDEARLSAYDGAIAEERKRDTALRIFIENIIHDWMSDPKSRGEFVHMWGAAKNDAEKARALFDPKGDGSYLKYLAELVAGLQSGERQPDKKSQNRTDDQAFNKFIPPLRGVFLRTGKSRS